MPWELLGVRKLYTLYIEYCSIFESLALVSYKVDINLLGYSMQLFLVLKLPRLLGFWNWFTRAKKKRVRYSPPISRLVGCPEPPTKKMGMRVFLEDRGILLVC